MTLKTRNGQRVLRMETLESRMQPGNAIVGEPLAWFAADAILDSQASERIQKSTQDRDMVKVETATASASSVDAELAAQALNSDADLSPANTTLGQDHAISRGRDSRLPESLFNPLKDAFEDVVNERSGGSRSSCLAPGTFVGTINTPTFGSDLTPDGCTVAGFFSSGAFKWTPGTRIRRINGPATGVASVSADGGVVTADVKQGNNQYTANRWTSSGGWQSLGGLAGSTGCDASLSNSYSLSADGSKQVGLGWLSNCRAHAFVWEAGTGMVDLGALGGRSSRASGISDDGSTIVGFDEHGTGHRRSAVWRNGVETVLSDNPGELYDATPNGGVVVGKGSSSEGAARWTENAGTWTPEFFGNLPGTSNATGLAVSDDGSVIVGISGSPFDNSAFYYSAATGLVRMTDHLASQGIDVTGWTLTSASGISADGKTISGSAFNPQFKQEAWIVQLPD